MLNNTNKHNIESNLRIFYTHHVPLLLRDRSWWGKLQHGLGMTGLLAPLTYKTGYSTILISSTYTDKAVTAWGSTMQTDNTIKWSGTRVIHESSAVTRFDKIGIIISYSRKSTQDVELRVCYSSKNTGINCSHCEKCYRTILALMLHGADPNKFGFKVSANVYHELPAFVRKGFYSEGDLHFWKDLAERIKQSADFFYFKDKSVERHALDELSNLIVLETSAGLREHSRLTLFRQKIQIMFPALTQRIIAVRNRLVSN